MAKRRGHGEGTITYWEDKKLWVARITLPNGKRRAKYGKTQKEAKDWLLGQRDAIRDQNWVETESVTLAAFLDRYLTDIAAHNLKPKTIEAYEYLIRMHIKPALGQLRLVALRPDHLQKLYSDKLNAGLSSRTVQFMHTILHVSLQQAYKWGLVGRNVADLVDAPTVKKRRPAILSVDQSRRFLDQVKSSRFYPMYALAFLGLREGEILGTRIEGFSKTERTLQIDTAVQYLVGKGLVETELKTDASRRKIKLPEFAYQALLAHCEPLERNQGLMFTTGNGTPFSPRNFYRDFQHQLEVGNFSPMRFHDLRHSAISYLLNELHLSPSQVQAYVGHSSPWLTLDVYSHTTSEMDEATVRRMDQLFS